jgi:hypothetical protein
MSAHRYTPIVSLDCGCGCGECTDFCECACPLCVTLRRARRSGEWPDSSTKLLRACTSAQVMRRQHRLEAAVVVTAAIVFLSAVLTVATLGLAPVSGPCPPAPIDGALPPPMEVSR